MSDGQPDDADRQDYRQVFDRLAVFLRDKRFAEGAEYLRSYIARQRDSMARFEPMGDLAVVLEVNGELSERSEEHTSELQSLMRISYAVFCLKKKTTPTQQVTIPTPTQPKQ